MSYVGAANSKENNSSGDKQLSAAKVKAKRRSTLTREEFRQLSMPQHGAKRTNSAGSGAGSAGSKRRSSSALSGIDPVNIIPDPDAWSTLASGGGCGCAGLSPSPSTEESQARADALSAELDRILGPRTGSSSASELHQLSQQQAGGGGMLRRSLRRKSFSISLAQQQHQQQQVQGQADSVCRGSAAPDVVPDEALIQLYCQKGAYVAPKPRPLVTIPEATATATATATAVAAGGRSGRHRRIDFDSAARLSAKERTRLRKAQKVQSAARGKGQKAAAAGAASKMSLEEFQAFVDGLNLSERVA